MPAKEDYITISTTFTGEHAELIRQLAEEYHCSKPNALRLLLGKFINGNAVSISGGLRGRVENILGNPLIQNQLGTKTVEEFVEYAVSSVINDLLSGLKDLRDPSVQLMLNEDELQVAMVLLRRSELIENYGGISVGELVNQTHLKETHVRSILKDFMEKGWVGKTKVGKYLPIKYMKR